MSDPTMRMRVALGFAVAIAVLLAFMIGAGVLALLVGPASNANAGVPSGAVGGAMGQALFPSLVVGGAPAYVYRPDRDQ